MNLVNVKRESPEQGMGNEAEYHEPKMSCIIRK
jgi:hypothetical protein